MGMVIRAPSISIGLKHQIILLHVSEIWLRSGKSIGKK